ncbi:type II toxin-antitoxin system RelE/ParE family toxin [Leptospira santarosai]|uniref:type II toxin-antitoxin system RelE/ParE family toxin n=1 Tax=Leptospira santarosai TaxID=28183 RepID=UPI0005195510|nr:type II toxin-antitoxin system RelE/ParE family toxin [Leptospira santarosai]
MKRIFIHLPDFDLFWKKAGLEDGELKKLQEFLLENPKYGPVIKGSNGIRKIRWKKKGIGKSGGVRVFYLDIEEFSVLFLITLLEKNDKENLSKKELVVLAGLVTSLKELIQSKRAQHEERK